MRTIASLAADLVAGRTTSRALAEQAIAQISTQSSPAFLKVFADSALAEADASDRLRALGIVRSPVEGLPVSVKDLFDVAGDVTRAGSSALAKYNPSPAPVDAPAVARLRAAGAVIIAKTNMVEFAFGGVGTNPSDGTPTNPADSTRVPGGSSGGAAVGVARDTVSMGLGTDTRGSVRIPAALCGVTGFKPTQARVPLAGAFPLSYTLDSVGPLCHTVADCAVFDAILSGEGPAAEAAAPIAPPVRSLRLLHPIGSYLLDGLDETVDTAFKRSMARLLKAGAMVFSGDSVDPFANAQALFDRGGFASPEAYQIHKPILASHSDAYDPNVASRIALGEQWGSAADYVQLTLDRKRVIREANELLQRYDALVCPTTPIVAPTIEEVSSSPDAYVAANMNLLRNPGLANMIDGCAVTIPCHEKGELPVGLMLIGANGSDRKLLGVARAVESVLGRGDAWQSGVEY